MGNNHQQKDRETVLLRVESESVPGNTIDLAIAIAASVQSQVHGLFVENQDLLRVASLPFTREISSTTAREHQTSLDQMQRSLRAVAAQFRKSLEQAALASQVPWSFDYVSEREDEAEWTSRHGITYTIVGNRSATQKRPRQFRAVLRVLLIENHSPQLLHALGVVLQWFKQDRVEVTVIHDQANGEQKAKLAAYIKGLEQPIRLIELGRNELVKLLIETAASYDCVIISKYESLDNQLLILKYLTCPVIIVSR
ncbi:MAG: hypothetical protein OEY09_14375 [Gammaproteobacteria bacterium]|nr:hypothetical protein [Gammaproteobacteria bacterium]